MYALVDGSKRKIMFSSGIHAHSLTYHHDV